MRLRVPTLVLIGAMLLVLSATYGCSGKSASGPGAAEPTSGGEAADGSEQVPSGVASFEAESPGGSRGLIEWVLRPR